MQMLLDQRCDQQFGVEIVADGTIPIVSIRQK
jgi:hypothetical protein